MAAQQGVSVNTVDTAYQMLAAEGLANRAPAAAFTCRKLTACCIPARRARPPQAVVPAALEPVGEPATLFDLSTGSVDTALFPARSWGRIQKELLYQRPELLQRGEMQGDADLRVRSRTTPSDYRGCGVYAGAIVVVRALSICWAAWRTCSVIARRPSRTRATPARGRFWATAAYPTLVDIDRDGFVGFGARGQRGKPVLSDAEPSFSHRCNDARHPPGTTAGLGGRKPGRYILEDDYDSEFRFDTRPSLSAGHGGADGPVVYLTTFSKSLAPGIRIAAWCCRKVC